MKVSVAALSVVIATVLVSAGCAEQSHSAVSEKAHAAAKKKVEATRYKKVEFDTDAGVFRFEPSQCSVHDEDGSLSYMIGGRGLSPDERPVYVELGGGASTGVEMGISVGVDAPFKRGDPEWNSNDYQSSALDVAKSQSAIEGRVVTVTGVVFGKDHGGQLVVNGPIRVDCTPFYVEG